MSIQLQEAINRAETFESLIPIAERLEAKLSFWGSRWVEMSPASSEGQLYYPGTACLTAVVKRAWEIIETSGRTRRGNEQFKNEEHEACRLLENAISVFYTKDKKNYDNANIITKIFVLFRGIFRTDYQYEWRRNRYGDPPQILERYPEW